MMLPAYGLVLIGLGWYSIFYFEHDRTLGWDKIGVRRSPPKLVRQLLRAAAGPVLVGSGVQQLWAVALVVAGLALELGITPRPDGEAIARIALVYGGLGAAGISLALAVLGWLRRPPTGEARSKQGDN